MTGRHLHFDSKVLNWKNDTHNVNAYKRKNVSLCSFYILQIYMYRTQWCLVGSLSFRRNKFIHVGLPLGSFLRCKREKFNTYFPFFNMFAWHPSAAQNYRAFPPSVEPSSHWKCQWLTKSRGHVTPLYKSIIKTVFLQHPANVLLLHILPNYNKYTRFNAFPI